VIRVLDVRRGDGTYVTSLEPNLLLEAMTFVVDLHSSDSVLELFEARRILEPAATAMATTHLDADGIAGLRAEVASVTEESSVEDLVSHDIRFHARIVDRAGNSYVSALIESLSGSTARARIWRGLTQANAASRTITEHSEIVDALEAGDARLAETLAAAHIYGVEQWLRQWRDAESSDAVTDATS